MNYLGTKIRVKFSGSCLKQDNVTYTYGKIVNIYIVYEINKKDNTVISNPTLENCLFDAVTLTKNADIDKYGYSGYGIGFDRKGSFSFPSSGYGQNLIIVGVDLSSSIHIDNKRDILLLGRGPTHSLIHLCLGNISKDWSTDNMKKKTGFNGYAYDFSAGYDATDNDDIKDIHNYLMKKK